MTATVNAADGGNTIAITFGGTPAAVSSAAFGITIPASALTSGSSLAVNPNPDAKFNIMGGAPPTTYALTVQNGTGGGNYAQGAQVTITANAAPSGKVFDRWTGKNGGSYGSGGLYIAICHKCLYCMQYHQSPLQYGRRIAHIRRRRTNAQEHCG